MMDWQPWLEQGVVQPARRGGPHAAMDRLKPGWQRVVGARAAYLNNDWDGTDTHLREAFAIGTQALLLSEELELAGAFDLECSQRMMREFFGDRLVDSIYERARIVRHLMPLPNEIHPNTARLVRRSIAASAEFMALVEQHCFMETVVPLD